MTFYRGAGIRSRSGAVGHVDGSVTLGGERFLRVTWRGGGSGLLAERLAAKACGFCLGEPVGDAASWLDGVPRAPAPCPRCGEVAPYDLTDARYDDPDTDLSDA
jgi:hypothetical protein